MCVDKRVLTLVVTVGHSKKVRKIVALPELQSGIRLPSFQEVLFWCHPVRRQHVKMCTSIHVHFVNVKWHYVSKVASIPYGSLLKASLW